MKQAISIVAVLLSLAGPAFAAQPSDAWAEEVLLQLSELRKAQGELKQQVADLRAEVATLRTGNQGGAVSLDLRSPDLPSLGDSAAQIAIVEFSDFECPYCRRHKQATLPALREKYLSGGSKQVRYFFLDYPLSFHRQAAGAAAAAACAHRQSAFWKMHELLFANQGKLSADLYRQLAGELQLDQDKFQACLADPQIKQQIDARAALGERAGVRGTPAFVIGRLKDGMLTDIQAISGAQPIEQFEKVLNRYLTGS